MKKKKILKALFISLLIVLAASPISILGHEIWHIIFGYFYGQPVSLCVNFNQKSFASVQVEHPPMRIETACNISFYNELVAHLIGVGILFLMLYIFTKKYQELIDSSGSND